MSNVPDFDKFPDWMSELPDELTSIPLGSITIPGHHIALAIDHDMRYDMDFSRCNYEMAEFLRKLPNLAIFNNFRNLMKKIWRAWMPKQMLSIYHQMEAGSRYFDIRITKYRSAFYGEHGLYTRQFKKYLKEMKSFIDEHPREVIMLHFQQLQQLERTDKRRLVTVLFQIFGAKMARSADLSTVTLQLLWRHKKQVIVFFPGEDMPVIRNHIFAGLVWSDDIVHTTLPKKQSVPDLVEFLDQHYAENVMNKRRKDSKLYVTKAVLSPDMTMVFGDFQYKSMRQLSHCETLHTLVTWLRGRSRFNVVCVDFVGGENLVQSILLLNGEHAIRQNKMETVV
ncbi:hypothetical protein CAPTEDRAFT_123191 [Capitella teleta]|uniref:Phosphatidylinositol-specific phospholipase C X domain-containing protein n=1 Tax=Capitella teleta TaxID=283909 RepID=R7UKH0_CAPTE|nr:hypothetical protein CAPTEDRAFT_123191 [Capitella teleta]|eukprot:ELU07034.1 hypothetical protein CAPTEDRAFT_123191 [Capitella teleta]